MRRLSIAPTLVALLVVVSGCAGVLDPGTERTTATTTPEPANTTTLDETESRVYSILAEGVTEARSLADAHVVGLEGRSYTTRTVWVVRAEDGTASARFVSVAEVGPEGRRFVHSRNYTGDAGLLGGSRESRLLGAYSNGTVTFGAWSVNGSTEYTRFPANATAIDAGNFDGFRSIVSTFDGVNVTLDGIVTRNGTRLFRVVSTDGPHGYGGPNVSDVRLVALVDADGVVRERRLNYTGVRDGRRVRIERRVVYEAIGGTTVDPPPWLAEARNRTAPVGDG